MGQNCTQLALGNSRFSDPSARSLADNGDMLGAWRHVLETAPKTSLQSVQGDFAVGLQMADGRTVLAVDRFAIRSLCYCIVNGQMHFAARADELAGSSPDIDPQGIFDYLYFHVIPSPRTIFKGIFRLPPGHVAIFDGGKLTVEPYWLPRFDEQPKTSFAELRSEFRQLLRSSVATQLEGGNAACFLSGGTDSSTVAGMATQVAGRAITYSIGFEAQGYDEMAFARITANHFGTEHHEYYVTPDDLVRSIPSVAAHYDQPFGNSSALPAYYCAKVARDDGIVKMLAGDGGDELFGGNSRYAKQRVFGWYEGIPAPLRTGLLDPLANWKLSQTIPLVRKSASYVRQARVAMPDRMMTYNLIMRLGVQEVLTPDFLAQVDVSDPERQQRSIWAQSHGGDLLNRMLAFDWRYTLAECDLPKVVGTTALAGVAVGFPLLDDRLVAFSQRLPVHYKLNRLRLRWFFKEALKGFLPDETIRKKKQGFGLPFGVWANSHVELKRLASTSLERLVSRGIVSAPFVHLLLGQRLAEHPGYYGEMIWILMMLEQWLAAKAPNYRVAS